VGFILRRTLTLIPVLFGMSILLFLISHTLPADPVRVALGQDATETQVQAYREQLRLNDPLPVQYYRYITGLLFQGDLGTSIISRRPVLNDLRDYFPATMELALASMLISLLVAVPLGVTSAVRRGAGIDHVSRVVSLFAVSMPVFWLGLLFQLIFYATLDVLPFGSRLDSGLPVPAHITGLYTIDSLIHGDTSTFFNAVTHLILPAVALSNINIAILVRITRSSMLDVLSEGYITTARAKGLRERTVIYRHALKNAAVPVVTIGGMRFGELVGGAILTETIFDWPGIGRYAVFSIERVDFPALMGVAWVAAFLYAVINIAVDLTYAHLDPRTR
jgi:peptide/nickel transport system permease protein